MKVYDFIVPREENDYRLFNSELEDDPLTFFHITPETNVESIKNNGFRFGPHLQSVSYAKNSSMCLTHRGQNIAENYAVFVVKFTTLEMEGIEENNCDIHVRYEKIQPTIIGIMIIPKSYDHR